MQCPQCGSMMNPNKFKQAGDTKPDWICSNSECKNEKGFRTGVWNKKEHTLPPKSAVLPPKPAMGSTGVPMQPQTPVQEPVQTQNDILNREGLAKSALESGRVLDEALQNELKAYENWVKFGEFIPF